MWPERDSNHSGEKPNGLKSQLSYPLGYGARVVSIDTEDISPE